MREAKPQVVVVMGVAGAGKTRIGSELAARLALEYRDGDDFHPPANIAKMASGVPLDDADRIPWLRSIATFLHERRELGAVVSCSALRRRYRDELRALEPTTFFLHLTASRELIEARVARRRDHFMPASLVDSQLALLEPLAADERGLTVDAGRSPDDILAEFLARA